LDRLHRHARERDADSLEDSGGQELDVEMVELLNCDQLRIARDALRKPLTWSDYVERQAKEMLRLWSPTLSLIRQRIPIPA